MATTRRGRLIVLGVAIIALFSAGYAVWTSREKGRLAEAYAKAQQELQQLEAERAHLSDELLSSRETLEDQSGDMAGLQSELETLQQKLQETSTELTALQSEHQQLRAANVTLTTQLSSVTAEKQQLEAKLSSMRELKLAIRDVRRKIQDQRWAAWRARVVAQRQVDQEALAKGNRGYVVRGGTSTLGSTTKLQVHVLEPQSQ